MVSPEAAPFINGFPHHPSPLPLHLSTVTVSSIGELKEGCCLINGVGPLNHTEKLNCASNSQHTQKSAQSGLENSGQKAKPKKNPQMIMWFL